MLAPNPQAETTTSHAEKAKKFVFVAVLVVAYTVAVAALIYPVAMYVFW